MNQLDHEVCVEVFQRLDDYLDRELEAAERNWIQAHLEVCAACAREARFEESLLHGIRHKLADIPVPEGLMQRLSERLSGDSRAEP